MTLLKVISWIILLVHSVSGYRLVCVYTNWSQYRPDGGKFLPEDVDPSLCTHLIYVYAKLQGNKLAAVEWNDDGTAWKEGMYQRVNTLKQYNPDLKTLLGVGGWMMGSKDFSRMASTRRSRRIFTKSVITFLRTRDFDGLTIDWQHPTKRGGRPKDRVNFSLLLQELRRAFEDESKQYNRPSLLLTVGVSASKYIIDSAYEVKNISRYADFINVFAYDLHGPWDNYTGHPSPLYAREDELGPAADINIDSSMKHWISYGVDRSKLVLGISTYGRTFTLKEPRHNSYMVPTTGPGVAGEFTREPGMLAFYERCSQYFDAPRVWDKHSRVAYWHSGDQWIAGEDIESVKHKVNWVRHNGIGGVMLSSLDMDDFSGLFCTGDFYPILDTINKQFTAPLQPLFDASLSQTKPNRHSNIGAATEEFTTTQLYPQGTDGTNFDLITTPMMSLDILNTIVKTENSSLVTPNAVPVDTLKNEITVTEKTGKPIPHITSTSTISNEIKTPFESQPVDKTKQRNERLISQLLNIFKAQGMMNLGNQQGSWAFSGSDTPQIFGQPSRNQGQLFTPRESSDTFPRGIMRKTNMRFQEDTLAVDATTRPTPFTVKPWDTFGRQTHIPNNGIGK